LRSYDYRSLLLKDDDSGHYLDIIQRPVLLLLITYIYILYASTYLLILIILCGIYVQLDTVPIAFQPSAHTMVQLLCVGYGFMRMKDRFLESISPMLETTVMALLLKDSVPSKSAYYYFNCT
jgi:hypothetical protein